MRSQRILVPFRGFLLITPHSLPHSESAHCSRRLRFYSTCAFTGPGGGSAAPSPLLHPEPARSRPPWNPCLVIMSLPCAGSELPLSSPVSPTPLEAARRDMTRGRHRRPTASATLPDDDEILLLLPPRPSSLPRASLVCKRWRRLVTDPHFRRRFRSRHPNPPLSASSMNLYTPLSSDP
jgi:hypothetical protein